MAKFERGHVIRIPVGSLVASHREELERSPTKVRKERVAVVSFVSERDNTIGCIGRRGVEYISRLSSVELISGGDNHWLTVNKHKRGGHPIAGWNWPLWAYDYDCGCGKSFASRDDYEYHIRHLEEDR